MYLCALFVFERSNESWLIWVLRTLEVVLFKLSVMVVRIWGWGSIFIAFFFRPCASVECSTVWIRLPFKEFIWNEARNISNRGDVHPHDFPSTGKGPHAFGWELYVLRAGFKKWHWRDMIRRDQDIAKGIKPDALVQSYLQNMSLASSPLSLTEISPGRFSDWLRCGWWFWFGRRVSLSQNQISLD